MPTQSSGSERLGLSALLDIVLASRSSALRDERGGGGLVCDLGASESWRDGSVPGDGGLEQ